jgi:hypothetical protein
MILRPVDPIGAYNRWDWIRAGLEHTIKRTGVHMRPEDAYVRIRNNSAWLYAIQAEEEDIGFLILTREEDPDGPVLFVWALWGERGKLAPIKQEIYADIDQLAKAAKAVRIRWQSPRDYRRERWGVRVAHVYEREV